MSNYKQNITVTIIFNDIIFGEIQIQYGRKPSNAYQSS